MCFQSLGFTASLVLDELSSKLVAASKEALPIKDRRIDASLLTENHSRYWSFLEEGEERERQRRLLERLRRSGSSRGRERLS
jgi:hypothetical protein